MVPPKNLKRFSKFLASAAANAPKMKKGPAARAFLFSSQS